MGFRDAEINKKQRGEYRILAAGDSHIYGQGLGDDELLTTFLEDELNSTGSACSFSVINMGIRAYSTNNELALLRKTATSLEPDHIMVFFYLNDFVPVNIAHRYSRFSGMDWYTFDFSDKPTDEHARKWRLAQLARSSAFLMWLHDSYRRLASESDTLNRILQDNIDQRTQEMIDGTIEDLDSIRLLAEDLGIRFTLAVIPVSTQITTSLPGQRYQPTLEQYANSTGADYLDLLPGLRMHHEQYRAPLLIPFDGHYNGLAHKVMAMSTFDHLDTSDLCPE
jgi:lysophospholipase L1-like esterase